MALVLARPTPRLRDLGRLHFIAIGGAGMSGIASSYLARGFAVSGSDSADSPVLADLASQGGVVWVGHDAAHVAGADTVVVSTAIRADNVELVEARRLGVPVIHRSVALAALMEDTTVVAVSGTHGKTTTTAMCVAGLDRAGVDSSYVIGASMLDTGLGAHLGTDPFFVVEADESDGSFRQYPTNIAVITGIEADHLDNWGTGEAYWQGFSQFVGGPGVRMVIVDGDDPGAWRLAQSITDQNVEVIAYGEKPHCRLRLSSIDCHDGGSLATLTDDGQSYQIRLSVPGIHNLHNAAAAFCVGRALGLAPESVLAGLSGFHGTSRRFETVARIGGVTIIDDYAHHPTEVRATLMAAREAVGGGRVLACFQPHLFSRTLAFADEFGKELARADQTVVLDIYPAREDPIPGVTGEMVAKAVVEHGGRACYVPDMADVVGVVADLARPGDMVLTIGAGSVTGVGRALATQLGA